MAKRREVVVEVPRMLELVQQHIESKDQALKDSARSVLSALVLNLNHKQAVLKPELRPHVVRLERARQ